MSAIATLLRYKEATPIGGVIGQCGFLGLKEKHFAKSEHSKKMIEDTPMLLMHGDKDELIPIEKAFESYKTLENLYANNKQNLKIVTIPGGEHSMWEKCNS